MTACLKMIFLVSGSIYIFKTIENPKELLFVWVVSINIHVLETKTEKFIY